MDQAGLRQLNPQAKAGALAVSVLPRTGEEGSYDVLPFKAEINQWGEVEKRYVDFWEAQVQGHVAVEIGRQLPNGVVVVEVPVRTHMGVRTPAVAWVSKAFLDKHRPVSLISHAPELCVEIAVEACFTPELQDRVKAYLTAGAVEVWVVRRSATISYFDRDGERAISRYNVALNLPAIKSGQRFYSSSNIRIR